MTNDVSSASVTAAFKTALVDACTAATSGMILPEHELLVRYGRSSAAQLKAYDEIIGVTRVTGTLDFGGMAASNRPRHMDLTAEIVISIFRAGPSDYLDDDAEQEAGDRAYALLGAIEHHVRIDDVTVGGTCRWCLCVDHESDGVSDPEVLARGRTIEITSSWLAKVHLFG